MAPRSPRQRQAVALYAEASRTNRTMDWVAEQMGCNKQNVSKLLKRAGASPGNPRKQGQNIDSFHGLRRYELGCRCKRCVEAHNDQLMAALPRARVIKWKGREGLKSLLAAGICPFCGSGPFNAIGSHFQHCEVKGLPSVREIKRMAGIPVSVGLLSESLREKRSDEAQERGAMPASTGGNAGRRWRLAPVGPVLDLELHGSSTAYKDGCRCRLCVDWNIAKIAKSRADRLGRSSKQPHGNKSTYVNYGCRCEPCREAHGKELQRRSAARNRSWRTSDLRHLVQGGDD